MSQHSEYLFKIAFGCNPDELKFGSLTNSLGEETVTKVLDYLVIFPPKLKEGKNNNPYGLIWHISKTSNYWKSNYSESSNND
jgi:hypothetical protein